MLLGLLPQIMTKLLFKEDSSPDKFIIYWLFLAWLPGLHLQCDSICWWNDLELKYVWNTFTYTYQTNRLNRVDSRGSIRLAATSFYALVRPCDLNPTDDLTPPTRLLRRERPSEGWHGNFIPTISIDIAPTQILPWPYVLPPQRQDLA